MYVVVQIPPMQLHTFTNVFCAISFSGENAQTGQKIYRFPQSNSDHCAQEYSCWWIKAMLGSVLPHIRQLRDERGNICLNSSTTTLPLHYSLHNSKLFLLSWQLINPQVSVTGKVLHKDCMSVSIPNVCRSHNRDKNRKERKIGIRIKKKAQRMAQGVTGVCQHSRPSPSTAESWLVPPGSAWWPYSHQSRRNFKFKSSTALRSDLGQLPEPQLCQKLPSSIT